MTRRVLTLSAAALACLGTFALAAPAAQAAVVEVVHSPISLGDYCSAQVNSSSTIGFYNGSLGCHRWSSSGTGTTYLGPGSAAAACAHLYPGATYLGHAQGASQSLRCTYSV
ncbi:hypothetical protein [Nonomuraea gerenzanensis]|uniref:Uncharacterized protein n=1 Tax=Nonomuraea gerenzanensis TaxID=93944 RepID=A0A1M4EIP2_9ACTN|nr:hypothetical protein [Nonomuraea gerenzanensis]UBU10265.1 hypothetical protein LCN96_38765 [Nonomuraea gerenzanensis]SBO98644.1 hypothetical protein BN4615_P8160 [Nonomuraea gerenzanensis]